VIRLNILCLYNYSNQISFDASNYDTVDEIMKKKIKQAGKKQHLKFTY